MISRGDRMKKEIHLKEVAYNFIKDKILSNEFESGQYLEESMLSEALGISRTPIREALNQLEKDRFVDIIRNKGVFVSVMDFKTTKELFDARYYLEPVLLQMSWENLEKDVLEGYLQAFEDLQKQLDRDRSNRLDYEFHNYLNSRCNNRYMIGLMQGLSDQFQRVRTIKYYDDTRLNGGVNEHVQLINLIFDNKKEEAVALLGDHIKSTQKFFVQNFIENWGD